MSTEYIYRIDLRNPRYSCRSVTRLFPKRVCTTRGPAMAMTPSPSNEYKNTITTTASTTPPPQHPSTGYVLSVRLQLFAVYLYCCSCSLSVCIVAVAMCAAVSIFCKQLAIAPPRLLCPVGSRVYSRCGPTTCRPGRYTRVVARCV